MVAFGNDKVIPKGDQVKRTDTQNPCLLYYCYLGVTVEIPALFFTDKLLAQNRHTFMTDIHFSKKKTKQKVKN